MAHLCSLFNINPSPRTQYSPGTNGLVELQNSNPGTHLLCLKKILLLIGHTNSNICLRSQYYSSFSTQTLLITNCFYTHPRIPLTFSLNILRDSPKACLAHTVIHFQFIHFIVTKISILFSTHSSSKLIHYSFYQLNMLC